MRQNWSIPKDASFDDLDFNASPNLIIRKKNFKDCHKTIRLEIRVRTKDPNGKTIGSTITVTTASKVGALLIEQKSGWTNHTGYQNGGKNDTYILFKMATRSNIFTDVDEWLD